MTSTRRAILVSEEQRDGLAAVDRSVGSFRIRQVLSAYDNAADQPRIQWCAEHGDHPDHCMPVCACGHWPAKHNFDDIQQCTDPGCKCSGWEPTQNACRVVTAIVVPSGADA